MSSLALDAAPPPRPRLTVSPVAVILMCAAALAVLGLTVLFSTSATLKADPYFYLKRQVLWLALAGAAGYVASRVDLEYLRRFAWAGGALALVALTLVFVPGLGVAVKGSRRWINLGVSNFQVSELAKLALVFVLAHYLALNQTRLGEFKRGFLVPGAIVGVFAVLIVAEPDYGTAALTVAIGLTLLFLAGARWRYILPSAGLVAAGFAVLVWLNPNRLARFTAYLDVEGNKSDGTFQLYQSLSAFAVGGVGGVGLGAGRQQYAFLPEAHTDFIFAIMGEELGLWCTLSVVVLFATMFVAGLVHLRRAPNLFQFLLVAGCVLIVSIQAIINLGVVTGLLPTKGMSLPFISAGGSNLLLLGLVLGLLVNTRRAWGSVRVTRSRRALREVVE